MQKAPTKACSRELYNRVKSHIQGREAEGKEEGVIDLVVHYAGRAVHDEHVLHTLPSLLQLIHKQTHMPTR